MRAFLFLALALALAAFFLICDPFGTPEPERCPGGICPTPEHSDLAPTQAYLASATPYSVADLFGPWTHPTQSETGPVLRAYVNANKPPRKLPKSNDGWRMRLFYPPGSELTAEDIVAEINNNNTLYEFCSRHAFASICTNDSRFNEWADFGYPDDRISLILVSPEGRSIYYTHSIARSPSKLLSFLQESKRDREQAMFPFKGGSQQW